MPEKMSVVEEVRKVQAELKRLKQKFNSMDDRKIQQTGGGTFFVTLPKEWAEKMKVKKGTKVTIVWNKDDSLTIVV